MGLIDDIKEDILDITSDNDSGYGVQITLTTPDGDTSVTINGTHTKHHMAFEADGKRINSKTASITFAEKLLSDAGYPVRNSAGMVAIHRHKVTVKDSTGEDYNYVVKENYPDETIGLIVCVLGDFE